MELSIYGVMKSNDPRFIYKYIKSFDGICRYSDHYNKFIYCGMFLTGSRTLTGNGYIISYNGPIQITIGTFRKNKPINTVTYKVIPEFFKLKRLFRDYGFSRCSIYYAHIYDNPNKIAKIYTYRSLLIDLELIDLDLNGFQVNDVNLIGLDMNELGMNELICKQYPIHKLEIFDIVQARNGKIKYEYDIINTKNNDWMDERERELYYRYKKKIVMIS